MSERLRSLLAALTGAGVELDPETTRDALWLALRRAERESWVGEPVPEAARRAPPADAARGEPAERESERSAVGEDSERPKAESIADETAAGRWAFSGDGGWGDSASLRRVALPAAAALPGARLLARALRPLRKDVAAPRGLVFDEAATVTRVAEEEVWLPVFRPATERWLEVALVVDASVSMWFWRRAAHELERTLRYCGAFRMVTTWWLDGESGVGEGQARLYAGDDDVPTGRGARHLREVTGPGTRRLVLVLSDCVSVAWSDGTMLEALLTWSRTTPVALVQVLPEELWERTALADAIPIDLRSAGPARPNRGLRWKPRQPWLDPRVEFEGANRMDQLLLPVASLDPLLLNRLARMVAGSNAEWTPGFFFDLTDQRAEAAARHAAAAAAAPAAAAPRKLAQERVDRFLSVASLPARRLAALLAAAPVLTPRLISLIRRQLLPAAGQAHEAEVVLGGLLKLRVPAGTDPRQHADVTLVFYNGVRPLLLEAGQAHHTLEVLKLAARAVEDAGVAAETFEAWLEDPAAAQGAIDLAGGEAGAEGSFLTGAAAVLGFLGGAHAGLVRMEEVVEPEAEEPGPEEQFEWGESLDGESLLEEDADPNGASAQEDWPELSPHALHGPPMLVGREDSLSKLDDWWDQAKYPVAVLSGEGGVGTTSVAQWWARSLLNRAIGKGPESQEVFAWSFEVDGSWIRFLDALEARWLASDSGGPMPTSKDLLEQIALADGWLLVLDGLGAGESQHYGFVSYLKAATQAKVPVASRMLLTQAVGTSGGIGVLGSDTAGLIEEVKVGPLHPVDSAHLLHELGLQVSPGQREELAQWAGGKPAVLGRLVELLRGGQEGLQELLPLLLRQPQPASVGDLDAVYRQTVEDFGSASSDEIHRMLDQAEERAVAGFDQSANEWLVSARDQIEVQMAATRPHEMLPLLRRVANVYERLNQINTAIEILSPEVDRALDQDMEVSLRRDVADLLRKAGRLDEAIEVIEKGLDHLDSGPAPLLFDLLSSKAHLLTESRRFDKAIETHERRVRLAQESNDEERRYQAHLDYGFFLIAQGLPQEALKDFSVAGVIAEALGDQRDRMAALAGEASALGQLGDFAAAFERESRRLGLAEELNDPEEMARTLADLGRLHEQAGDNSAARAAFERRLETVRNHREAAPQDLALALGEVARLLAATGDLDAALAAGQERIEVSRPLGAESLGYALIDHSYLLEQQPDVPAAVNATEQALEQFRAADDGPRMMHAEARLAQLFGKLDRPKEVRAHLEQRLGLAGDFATDTEHAYALLDYGRHLGEQGSTEDAFSYLQEAWSFAEKSEPQVQAAVLVEQARWQEEVGNLEEAERLLGHRIAVLSGVRMRESIAARGDLASFLARHERLSEALSLARERLGLAESLAPEDGSGKDNEPVVDALASYGRLLLESGELETAAEILNRRAREEKAEPGSYRRSQAIVDLVEIRERLEGDSAALEMLNSEWDRLTTIDRVDPYALSLLGEELVRSLRTSGGGDFGRAIEILELCSKAHQSAGNAEEAKRLKRAAKELDASWPRYEA